MLLAQVNRDTQGMEFQSVDGDPQQVTLCLTEAVTVAGEKLLAVILCDMHRYRSIMTNCYHTDDNIEGIDTVSLQAVTLVDGSTAYIQHSPKGITILSSFCLHAIYITIITIFTAI